MIPEVPRAELSPAMLATYEYILSRQALFYTQLGFHNELDLSGQKYLESLPKFRPRKLENGDFPIVPMVVDPRISWQRQAALAGIGISYYLRGVMSEVCDWQDDPHGFKTPAAPYITYVYLSDDYILTPDRRHEDVRQEMGKGQRGATIYDGTAFQILCPVLVRVHREQLHLIGTQVGPKDIAALRYWRDHVELCHYWLNTTGPNELALVCNRDIDF